LVVWRVASPAIPDAAALEAPETGTVDATTSADRGTGEPTLPRAAPAPQAVGDPPAEPGEERVAVAAADELPWAGCILKLRTDLANFEKNPDTFRGKTLIKQTIITWCDANGTSMPQGEEDRSKLKFDDQHHYIYRIDPHLGPRYCTWTRDEFPEYWEVTEVDENREFLQIPRLSPELRQTIIDRANMVLQFASGGG
jgi:hypothetical protein